MVPEINEMCKDIWDAMQQAYLKVRLVAHVYEVKVKTIVTK